MFLSCLPSRIPHAIQNLAKSCRGSFRPIIPGWNSARFSRFRGFVGMTEPIQRVVEVGIGSQCEREPAFARGVALYAKIALGPLQKSRGHGIEFQQDAGVRT